MVINTAGLSVETKRKASGGETKLFLWNISERST